VSSLPRISYARSADGVSLAFTMAGDGPALVFVPWVPFSNLRMEWQNPLLGSAFEQLARRLTLVHYDGRGTGHSQRDVTDLSLEAMVSDLEAVIDRAGLAQVSLLGQYNSCPHAIAYACLRDAPTFLASGPAAAEVPNRYRLGGDVVHHPVAPDAQPPSVR
jgi:pimeloyl-ACP methyl ester carboxylesterase